MSLCPTFPYVTDIKNDTDITTLAITNRIKQELFIFQENRIRHMYFGDIGICTLNN